MLDYKELNIELKESLSRKVLVSARNIFSHGLVMSSSLGRYSSVMLHLATSLIPGLPVINLRIKDETESTREHRKQLKKVLGLNLCVFDVQDDKAMALKDALKHLKAGALISGVMWEETQNRAEFDFFMQDTTFDVQRVYPLLHWKKRDLEYFTRKHRLPQNEDYRDSFKECSDKKECGIHLFENGGGI